MVWGVSEKPAHTAVASWGVKPTNQALSMSSVVPVLPADGLPDRAAVCPVPPLVMT